MNWRSWFGRSLKSREQISKAYIEALQKSVPGLRVEQLAPNHLRLVFPDGKDAQSYLENLWLRCEGRSFSEQIDTIDGMAAGIVESWNPPALLIQSVVPAVRSTELVNLVGETVLAAEHIAGDFWLVYVSDTPTSIRTVKRVELASLGYQGEDLKKITVANLERILPPVEVHPQDGWALITAGADYPSSLIFLERIRAEFERQFGAEYVIAIPSRDVLLVARKDRPDAIEQIKMQAQKVFKTAPYNISPQLLTWVEGGWKLVS